MTEEPLLVVVADTSVLINFLHMRRLDMLGASVGIRALVPADVIAELEDPTQRDAIESGLRDSELFAAGDLTTTELEAYARLHATLGAGESAALAVAHSRGAHVACDERRGFLREANALLGPGRVVNTPGLILNAIHLGRLGVDEADELKAFLETRRFKMRFESFAQLVATK